MIAGSFVSTGSMQHKILMCYLLQDLQGDLELNLGLGVLGKVVRLNLFLGWCDSHTLYQRGVFKV